MAPRQAAELLAALLVLRAPALPVTLARLWNLTTRKAQIRALRHLRAVRYRKLATWWLLLLWGRASS